MSVKIRKKRCKDGRQSIYLDIYHAGRRRYEFLHLFIGRNKEENKENLRLAESIRAKRQIEINSGRFEMVPSFKDKIDFIEFFRKKAAGRNKTWRACSNHLRAYQAEVLISAIDDRWLEDLKAFLLGRVSQNSARTYFTHVLTGINLAIKEKLISQNPASRIERIKFLPVEKSFLTLEEIQQLENTPCQNQEVKRAFLFCCFSGLRISDVEKLDYSEVKAGRITFRQTKTKSVEYLPLSEQAKRLLFQDSDVIPITGRVFHLPSKRRIDDHLATWVEAAGIGKKITFHSSRHTFATLALTAGLDLFTVSKLLGHKNLQQTQIYARIIDEKMRSEITKLPILPSSSGSR